MSTCHVPKQNGSVKWFLSNLKKGGSFQTVLVQEMANTSAGADPGEVKRVNFHPPFSEPPSFFFVFLSLKYWLVLIHHYKNSPPISKSWIRAWSVSRAHGIVAHDTSITKATLALYLWHLWVQDMNFFLSMQDVREVEVTKGYFGPRNCGRPWKRTACTYHLLNLFSVEINFTKMIKIWT